MFVSLLSLLFEMKFSFLNVNQKQRDVSYHVVHPWNIVDTLAIYVSTYPPRNLVLASPLSQHTLVQPMLSLLCLGMIIQKFFHVPYLEQRKINLIENLLLSVISLFAWHDMFIYLRKSLICVIALQVQCLLFWKAWLVVNWGHVTILYFTS